MLEASTGLPIGHRAFRCAYAPGASRPEWSSRISRSSSTRSTAGDAPTACDQACWATQSPRWLMPGGSDQEARAVRETAAAAERQRQRDERPPAARAGARASRTSRPPSLSTWTGSTRPTSRRRQPTWSGWSAPRPWGRRSSPTPRSLSWSSSQATFRCRGVSARRRRPSSFRSPPRGACWQRQRRRLPSRTCPRALGPQAGQAPGRRGGRRGPGLRHRQGRPLRGGACRTHGRPGSPRHEQVHRRNGRR